MGSDQKDDLDITNQTIAVRINGQSLNLGLDTHAYNLGVYTYKCKTCGVANKFWSAKKANQAPKIEFSEWQQQSNGHDIPDIKLNAVALSETVKLRVDQFNRQTSLDIFVAQVYGSESNFTSKLDGFVGIAPYTSDVSQKDHSFVYQLKQRGIIDNMIVSVYISTTRGVRSHVKFGDYDPILIKHGQKLNMFSTLNQTGWYLNGKNFGLGGTRFLREPRAVEFNAYFPYLYIPDYDFQLFIHQVQEQFPNAECHFQDNYCKLDVSCSSVPNHGWSLQIQLQDGLKNMLLTVPQTSILVSGKHFGENDSACYFSVFRSHLKNDLWSLGSIFFQKYYIVYDMTPLDRDKGNRLQVGIAPINTTVMAIKSQYDEFHVGFDPRNQDKDQSVVVEHPLVVPNPTIPAHPEQESDDGTISKPETKTKTEDTKNGDGAEQTGHWLPQKHDSRSFIIRHLLLVVVMFCFWIVMIAAIVYMTCVRKNKGRKRKRPKQKKKSKNVQPRDIEKGSTTDKQHIEESEDSPEHKITNTTKPPKKRSSMPPKMKKEKKVKEPKIPKEKKTKNKSKNNIVPDNKDGLKKDQNEFTDEEAMALKMQSLLDLSQVSESGDQEEGFKTGIQ